MNLPQIEEQGGIVDRLQTAMTCLVYTGKELSTAIKRTDGNVIQEQLKSNLRNVIEQGKNISERMKLREAEIEARYSRK